MNGQPSSGRQLVCFVSNANNPMSANGQCYSCPTHKQLASNTICLWNKNGIFTPINRSHALDLFEDRVQESEKE